MRSQKELSLLLEKVPRYRVREETREEVLAGLQLQGGGREGRGRGEGAEGGRAGGRLDLVVLAK